MPVGIAVPVSGQLIMSIPILECFPWLDCVARTASDRSQLDRAARGEAKSSRLRQDGRTCTAVYKAPCSALAKLFLIGSADWVATFCASSRSSLFWADATSKFLRLCV